MCYNNREMVDFNNMKINLRFQKKKTNFETNSVPRQILQPGFIIQEQGSGILFLMYCDFNILHLWDSCSIFWTICFISQT